MHNASIKERMFLCLVTLSFFVLIVSLLVSLLLWLWRR